MASEIGREMALKRRRMHRDCREKKREKEREGEEEGVPDDAAMQESPPAANSRATNGIFQPPPSLPAIFFALQVFFGVRG